jgi:hypothetical protein
MTVTPFRPRTRGSTHGYGGLSYRPIPPSRPAPDPDRSRAETPTAEPPSAEQAQQTSPAEPTSPATVTISIDVTLTGDRRYDDAVAFVTAVREVAETLGTASVSLASTSTIETSAGPARGVAAGLVRPDPRRSVSVPGAVRFDPGATRLNPSAGWSDASSAGRTVPASHEPPPPGPSAEVHIYPDIRRVTVGRRALNLTRLEFDLLLFLAEHPQRVHTRAQLLRAVWGHNHAGPRTVDVHIRRLRMKVTDALFTTVRGVGYRIADDAPLTLTRQA